MSTNKPVVPGETIPLEHFPAHIKQRAQILGAMVSKLEAMSPTKIDQILTASDSDLRKIQLGDKLTYDELDEKLLKGIFYI